MRGAGIDLAKRYEWIKQPNGAYTILDVEVFGLYEDAERGKLDEETARQVLRKFWHDRNNGQYSPVHLYHNEDGTTDNRKKVGFIDNLRFDGRLFWADLCEVPSDMIEALKGQKSKYPYRSVEYNPEKRQIEGLALLESRRSYFDFPLLALREVPKIMPDKFQDFMNGRAIKFQAGSDCTKDKSFCGSCDKKSTCQKFTDDNDADDVGKMPEDDSKEGLDVAKFEEENNMMPTGGAPEDTASSQEPIGDGEPTGLEPEGDAAPPWAQELTQSIAEIKQVLRMLIETDQEVHEGAEEKTPAPVAMQSDGGHYFQSIERRLAKIENEKRNRAHMTRLQSLCDAYGYDYETESQILQKFQGSEKVVYLDSLEIKGEAGAHPMAAMLANTKFQSADTVLQKFQNEPAAVRKVAKRALQDYRDTVRMNNAQAKKFQAMWPTPESWVVNAVEEEKEEPGTYARKYHVSESL